MKRLKESLLDNDEDLFYRTGDYMLIKDIILKCCNTSSHFIDEYNYKNELSKTDPILDENFDKIFTIKNKVVSINLYKANKIKNLSIYATPRFLKEIQLGDYVNEYASGALRINYSQDVNLLKAKKGVPSSISGFIVIKAENVKEIDFTKVKTSNKSDLILYNKSLKENINTNIKFENNTFRTLSLLGQLKVTTKFPTAQCLKIDNFAAAIALQELTGIEEVNIPYQ